MSIIKDNYLSVYIGALSLVKFAPFVGENTIGFITDESKLTPAQWNIIIGNNNTGKTRILKSIVNAVAVTSRTTRSFDNAYQTWLFDKLTQKFNDLGLNPKEVSKKDFEKEFKNIHESSEDLYSKIPTVLVSTIYKDFVSENIADDSYKAIFSKGEDVEREDIILNIGEAKYGCTVPHNIHPFVVAYGVNRKASESNLSSFQNDDPTENLINNDNNLLNVEDWLIQTDYALKNNIEGASVTMNKVKKVLTSGILPDVDDFRFVFERNHNGIQNYVEFHTPYGWAQLDKLGYGYQASITWLLDLSKRMIDRYVDVEDPLHMPAIVLVDEIDLHLHPAWQRKIIGYLSDIFPNVQFIVTAHSPLIIQSAKEINLIVLKNDKSFVRISQPDISSYKGWSVEEIMSELMGLEDATFSDAYLELMADFDKALDENNSESAKIAYDKLDKILPPDSGQRKILRIQMSTMPTSK